MRQPSYRPKLKSLDPRRVPSIAEYRIPAASSNSTVDDSALNDQFLSVITNGSVEGGVFKSSRRYRQWSDASGAGALHTAVAVTIAGAASCKKIIAMSAKTSGPAGYVFKVADMGAILTASTAAFGTSFGLFDEAVGRWVAYQHIDRAFFVGGANGNVRMISSICGTPTVSLVYKPTRFPSNQVVATTFDTATDYFTALPGWGTKDFPHILEAGLTTINAPDTSLFFSPTTYPITGNRVNYASALALTASDSQTDLVINPNGAISFWNVNGNYGNPLNYGIYTFQATQDYTEIDYLYFKYEGKKLGAGTPPYANTATIDQARIKVQKNGSGTWVDLPCLASAESSGGNIVRTHVWADLTNLDPDVKAAIKKIHFPLIFQGGGAVTLSNNFYYDISFHRGGKAYKLQSQVTDTLSATPPQEDLNYYFRYVSSDGLTISKPITVTIPPSVHEGVRPNAGIPKIGQEIQFVILNAGAPWESTGSNISNVEVYRKVTIRSTGEDRYYLLGTVANPVTSVAFLDVKSDKELIEGAGTYLPAIPDTGILPSGSTAITNIVCGCSWKGSNVLFDNAGLAYFSKVGTYAEFMFPNDGYQVDPEDLTRPRFEQVTPDALPIIAAIGKDALYMFSENRVYAMSGDYIATCPPARPLPNASGILGARAYCGYGGGVIYAARDGLWFIQVPFGFSGSAEQVESKEITISNRACWEWLYNGGGSNITISTDKSEKDIWVFNGDRALHFTKESGWVRVLWGGSSDAKIFSAYHQTYGLVIGMSSHKFGLIGEFLTDGGTDLPGATGSTFIADFESRKFTDYRKVLRALVNVENPASGRTVTLNATSDRGTSENLTFNGANPVYNQSWNMSGAPSGGRWVKFKLSISPGTIIESATIQMTRHDTRRGK